MGDSSTSDKTSSDRGLRPESERFVYVVPVENEGAHSDSIDLLKLWSIVWRGKWQIIFLTLAFAIASIVYALALQEWYRAEALLAPAKEESAPAIGGQLGSLAMLAGVRVSGSSSVEAIATLRSHDFARSFIEDNELLPVFFHDRWDPEAGSWVSVQSEEIPDVRDAVKFFHESVLNVYEDDETGLVTVAVDWIDPTVAADWANDLTNRLNETLRRRALREATFNVAYLQEEIAETNVITLQQAIGRLLENEMQKLMLARGNDEFAFRVIDAAYPPKDRAHPHRKLIVIIGTMLGGMVGILWAFAFHAIKLSRPA